MTVALYTLPLLLPEACIAVKNKPGSRKRSTWKPSVIETMTYFIDVQKVDWFDVLLSPMFDCSLEIWLRLWHLKE